nr:hypothetical protein [uncultured Flavobacterium sp.]
MAINKTAKNIYIKVNGAYTISAGTFIETANKITITATKGNLNLISNKKIIITGKEGVTFGDYVAPPEKKHPEIIEIQFIDDKNTVLKQSSIQNFEGIKATDFFYGKKLKIKIITKEVEDGTKINFNLKAETKSTKQEFFGLDKLKWNIEIKSNSCETDFFELNPLWYSEDLENYNYDTHKTEIKSEDLNSFYVSGFFNREFFNLPEKEDRLKPIAYLRNYEELIGLFNTDNSGSKDLQSNYENKFISSNLEMLEIARDFSEFINNTKELTIKQIKTRVEEDAKCIWDASIKQVQSGKLDDRPLYWTRNKMQVRLKRHFLFEKDIDFEKSIVKKETELEKIIQIFEEKSRNYTGIDFSKAGGKKKVLITGFDPFILNQFDNNYLNSVTNPNILQSNPSGVMALALANDDRLGVYIQTMIVPVRYTDFDRSQDYNNGQGVGIIEKYIKPFINQVDMIITISQAGENDYNIDKFGTATRGGFNDNQDYIRATGSQALITKDEWIETTLPIEFTNASKVVYNWEFDNIPNPTHIKPIQTQKLSSGSGGDYLSNEIFYRVAKLRKDNNPMLPTGHFHISKIQNPAAKEDLNPNEILDVLNTVKEGIKEGVKGL